MTSLQPTPDPHRFFDIVRITAILESNKKFTGLKPQDLGSATFFTRDRPTRLALMNSVHDLLFRDNQELTFMNRIIDILQYRYQIPGINQTTLKDEQPWDLKFKILPQCLTRDIETIHPNGLPLFYGEAISDKIIRPSVGISTGKSKALDVELTISFKGPGRLPLAASPWLSRMRTTPFEHVITQPWTEIIPLPSLPLKHTEPTLGFAQPPSDDGLILHTRPDEQHFDDSPTVVYDAQEPSTKVARNEGILDLTSQIKIVEADNTASLEFFEWSKGDRAWNDMSQMAQEKAQIHLDIGNPSQTCHNSAPPPLRCPPQPTDPINTAQPITNTYVSTHAPMAGARPTLLRTPVIDRSAQLLREHYITDDEMRALGFIQTKVPQGQLVQAKRHVPPIAPRLRSTVQVVINEPVPQQAVRGPQPPTTNQVAPPVMYTQPPMVQTQEPSKGLTGRPL